MNTNLGDYIYRIYFELNLIPERFGSFFKPSSEKQINKLRNYGLAVDYAIKTLQGEKYLTNQEYIVDDRRKSSTYSLDKRRHYNQLKRLEAIIPLNDTMHNNIYAINQLNLAQTLTDHIEFRLNCDLYTLSKDEKGIYIVEIKNKTKKPQVD